MALPVHTSDLFAASLAAELVQRGLLHPIDTLKARLQYGQINAPATDQALAATRMARMPLLGDLVALRAAAAHNTAGAVGIRSLYRGLVPALIGVVPNALVYMPTYELSKTALNGTPFAALAGCITGCACAVVRVPISVVKSRVQLQLYAGPLMAVRASISGPDGLGGLYAGFRATLVHDVSYATIQFALLEQVRLFADCLVDGRALTVAENGTVGFVVGLCTASLTGPLDMIRTRLMAQTHRGAREGGRGPVASAEHGRAFGYRGLFHGLRSAASADGFAMLWRGLLPRLILKSVGSSVWYTVYMTSRKRLAERRSLQAESHNVAPD
jgi:solute carrier family 25 S-adenosylmethionine transporter 26